MASYAFKRLKGYGVASGNAVDSMFPKGTIELQRPYFKQLGLDITPYFSGTLNIALVNCKKVELIKWDYEFKQVKWLKTFPAEDFRFADCKLRVNGVIHKALIYQPSKATKTGHIQPDNCLEILAPYIDDINKGELIIEECYLSNLKA